MNNGIRRLPGLRNIFINCHHCLHCEISSLTFIIKALGTPTLGHIRDVQPEWLSFPGPKPVNGCKFLTKNLGMCHNFDIILPGNQWFSSKLNKAYCSLVNFASCSIVNRLRMGLALFIDGFGLWMG